MEGTFVTGIELLNQPPSQINESRPKQEEKVIMPSLIKGFSTKVGQSVSARAKSVEASKNKQFPPLEPPKEVQPKSSNRLRSSMSEVNLNKPLFKKLANVKEIYERNKSIGGFEKAKMLVNKAAFFAKKREDMDQKNYTHADAFNQKIVQNFDDLYSNRKRSGTVENLAKRKHFHNEIEKHELKVQDEQKKFNTISYEIAKNEKLLEKLQHQHKELDKKIDDTTQLEEACKVKEEELVKWQAKVELEEHNNKCLQHMRHLKKGLLFSLKKQYVHQKDQYDAEMENIEQNLRDLKNARRLIRNGKLKIEEMKKTKQNGKENLLDPEFEEMLENEISEFEERRNLREILKHEKIIEEEIRLQEEEAERRAAIAKENKLRDEENRRLQQEAEHEKELNKIKKQYYEFQKVTNVSKKDELVEYFDGLEERGDMLFKEIDGMNENIRERKEELEHLKKQLKFKRFEEAKAPKDNFPQDIRIDDLEIILRDKLNIANERENNMKRVEKLSYEVCTVISRILKQLQKSKTPMAVDKNNVVDLLSICGLKLERMLTVVIKKRKTFFIESINTDGTIKEGPPTYMNLVSDDLYNKSKKRFEKELPIEIDEALESESL